MNAKVVLISFRFCVVVLISFRFCVVIYYFADIKTFEPFLVVCSSMAPMFHFLKWGENALSFHSYCQRAVTCLKGGGGGGGGGRGGGGSGLSIWKKGFRASSWKYFPCEASEQKLGQKPKSELKKIELSFCHHLIYLEKTAF